MNIDDVIYLACLLSCIALGNYVRKIESPDQAKLVSTAFGILIVFIVSGWHSFHCLISFLLCALAITRLHPSKCHLVSFGIMFGYLAFFRTARYFGLPDVPGHTNMIQMILTLKMSGVAFEKNTAYTKIQQKKKESVENKDDQVQNASDKPIVITDYDQELQNISIIDLFHYAFNYIGVLIGPYYRYRTYRDYFATPFRKYVDCTGETLHRMKYALLWCVIFLTANSIWPLSYVSTTEFYESRTWLYRLFYVWPTFLVFRMRIFTGLTLGECVCTNAGFGAYPDDIPVVSGEGPKEPYEHLISKAKELKYNYNAIWNVDVIEVETCGTMRTAMKSWNICIQYWLAINVYKRFPSRKWRTTATLLVSSFWHGIYPGHYFCLMGAPFYVPVEDIFNKVVRKEATGVKRKVIDLLFNASKFFTLAYLGMAFVLLHFEKLWLYYSSVYHFGYLYYAVLLVSSILLLRLKKTEKARKIE